jgi:hypothetical protein
MANRFAVANGDWSNTATWDGGTLPTSADDVYTNNFNVNVNQNIDVISLRNTAATGITAGGTFTFNTSGITADISDTIVINLTSTSFILVTSTTGLITINIPNGIVNGINQANSNLLNYTGNCNLTITCIGFVGFQTTLSASTNTFMINKTSTGVLIFNGNIQSRFGSFNFGYIINITSISTNIINGNILGGQGAGDGSIALNITNGDLTITGNVTGGSGGGGRAIVSTTNGTINVTGNVTGGGAGNGAISTTAGTLNVTGIIEGGTVNGAVGAFILGTGTLNHIGVAQASDFGSAIACNTPTTSLVTCTGPFLRNGFRPAIASQTLRINALSNPYFEFRKSDNTDVTYVDEDTLNFPIELDVREGTSYASGLYTGTLAVPLPSNVRVGIATDDTIGTADLTAEDFFDAIATSTNDIAIRLRNVATVETTGDQIANL